MLSFPLLSKTLAFSTGLLGLILLIYPFESGLRWLFELTPLAYLVFLGALFLASVTLWRAKTRNTLVLNLAPLLFFCALWFYSGYQVGRIGLGAVVFPAICALPLFLLLEQDPSLSPLGKKLKAFGAIGGLGLVNMGMGLMILIEPNRLTVALLTNLLHVPTLGYGIVLSLCGIGLMLLPYRRHFILLLNLPIIVYMLFSISNLILSSLTLTPLPFWLMYLALGAYISASHSAIRTFDYATH